MTVREALDQKRQSLAGKVTALIYNKGELFYILQGGNVGRGVDDSVYPVNRDTVAQEAKFFGVNWSEV